MKLLGKNNTHPHRRSREAMKTPYQISTSLEALCFIVIINEPLEP
jgi:23S rRNA maturation mini-RNase III